MPTLSPRALSLGFIVLLGGATVFAACDAGDDTVYPNPLPFGQAGGTTGAAGKAGGSGAGAGAGAGGGAAGKAGASGATGGSAGIGGTAGASGTAGGSGTAGASGAAAGSAGFGGASTFGGNAGASGSAGHAGTAGGAGNGNAGHAGNAGSNGTAGSAGAAPLSYDDACTGLGEALTKCGAGEKTINEAKTGCLASKACADSIYIDLAPAKVLACLGAACTVPSVLPSASDACLEQAATDQSKTLRDGYKASLAALVKSCETGGDPKSAAALSAMAGVHGFYRAKVYKALGNCVEVGAACTGAIACLKNALATSCNEMPALPDWLWATDAVITNATVPTP